MKKFLIILIALLIIIPTTFHFWIGTIIQSAIQRYLPPIVGVPVSIGSISVSFLDGEFKIKNLTIENPPQFGNDPSFSVGKIKIELDLISLFKQTIIIKKLEIERATAFLLIGKDGLNLDIINKNIQRYMNETLPSDDRQTKTDKHFIIKKLKFEDGAFVLGAFGKEKTIRLPDFEERNIGERKGNSLEATLAQIISNFSLQVLKEYTNSPYSF
jgi:uncharacterized protein involved in outer membrane biogenesis